MIQLDCDNIELTCMCESAPCIHQCQHIFRELSQESILQDIHPYHLSPENMLHYYRPT